MKLLQIIDEGFEFTTAASGDAYRSLKGLVNKNNGVWRSAKQRDFLFGSRSPLPVWDGTPEQAKKFFGIDFDPAKNERVVTVDAMIRHSEGTRGLRPVMWKFVVDDKGVARMYRIRFKGDMKRGTAPDTSKTELEWERPANVDTSALDAEVAAKAAAPASTSQHVGTVGERIVLDVKVEKVIDRGYGQFGQQWLTILKDPAGNTIFYNNYLEDEGTQLKIRAGIKSHITSKAGEPVTVITRPKRLVSEVLDTESPNMWRSDIDDDYLYVMQFRTSSGNEYEIFAMKPFLAPNEVDPLDFIDDLSDELREQAIYIEFSLNRSTGEKDYTLTGSGDAAEVFGIVVNAILRFVKEYKPSMIYFHAAEPKRQKLYTVIANRVLQKLPNWQLDKQSGGKFAIYPTSLK